MTARAGIAQPQAWETAIKEHDLPAFEPCRYRDVLVVAAHPDDETLGASGCLQALHEAGARLTLVVATDGEGAFPELDVAGRARLAVTRRRELSESLRVQGLADVTVYQPGFPDTTLHEHITELTAMLREVAAGTDACLAPWRHDPHPDHQAAAVAVADAMPPGVPVWGYPIWTRPWLRPDDELLAWHSGAAYYLDGRQQARKRAGIETFRSQLRQGPLDEAPILPSKVVAHFLTGTEFLFRTATPVSTPVERFREIYRADPDPWNTAGSAYECHKRAVSLGALPRKRYRRAVDVGCGTGLLTAELAGRCDELLAFDAVSAAVNATRAAVAGRRNVTVERLRLPEDFPPGPFDLVVCSEILYYLGEPDLTETLNAAAGALRPGGELLAISWLPMTDDSARNGSDVHRVVQNRPELQPLVCHREERFLLQLCRRR